MTSLERRNGTLKAGRKWVLRIAVGVWMLCMAGGVGAQTNTLTYDLDNVWLLPDISHPGSPAQLMTGAFEWTYEEGDIENGSGEFVEIYTPWYNPGIENLNFTIEPTAIEITLKGNYHDRGFDLTLHFVDPLAAEQPTMVDLVRSQFEIELGITWRGHMISGSIVPRNNTVTADDFSITRGTYASGSIADLASSDNLDVSARRNPVDVSSRVFLEVRGLSPSATPATLSFRLEASVFARSTVVQSIDLYNYVTGSWEEIDTRNATRFNDSTTTATASGDLARFVQAGTGFVEARCRFESPNPRQRFSANVDQTVWTIGQ